MRPKYVMVADDDYSEGPGVGLSQYPMLLEDFAKFFTLVQSPTIRDGKTVGVHQELAVRDTQSEGVDRG
ncbi:hypothetical protein [Acidithiobacillus sp.]|uniref:hypothetical protein n=1 Tax=Acidithiobacillus sp. TaxID=1872118 RepID=UPI002585857C|nr:hypothetical protein [Acidithiobacillus sp.]MDD5374434.1 hypothetical protein [Acidithiobacillus sp.]